VAKPDRGYIRDGAATSPVVRLLQPDNLGHDGGWRRDDCSPRRAVIRAGSGQSRIVAEALASRTDLAMIKAFVRLTCR